MTRLIHVDEGVNNFYDVYLNLRYRGLMIDVARHFLSVDTIFKIIRTMSMYKMNHLHLHLSDDEGWRIEMLTFPELTSVSWDPIILLFSAINSVLQNNCQMDKYNPVSTNCQIKDYLVVEINVIWHRYEF